MSSIGDQQHASVDFTVEDGKEFVGSTCLLNGEPALISGRSLPHAHVRQTGSGLGCEFAWPTVARIMNIGNGEFRS